MLPSLTGDSWLHRSVSFLVVTLEEVNSVGFFSKSALLTDVAFDCDESLRQGCLCVSGRKRLNGRVNVLGLV